MADPVLPPPPVLPPQAPLPFPPPPQPRAGKPVALIVIAMVASLALVASLLGNVSGTFRATHGPHAFLEQLPDGAPYRWNPCQPIHYVVNPSEEPAGAGAVVREAIRRVSDATGISFVYDGTTVETVDQQIGSAYQAGVPGPRYLPLLIAFVPGDHFDFLADTRRAIAFGMPYRGEGDAAHTYVSGVVAIDARRSLSLDFASRFSLGPVLMHELGHVMGLAHVGAGSELMWSPTVKGHTSPNLSQTDWGPGDLEGLRLLGRDAGCLPRR